jgi:xanthine dehydrogenase YagR molybdenum-binding subunit
MATSQIPQGAEIIGAAVPRIDGPLKTTGTARYSLDRDFPNLAHGVAVQATIGKGRIRSLDASEAERMPGVLLVLYHGKIKDVYRTFPRQQDGSMAEPRPPFEDEKIYYWGQYVAAVVAETLEQARAAAAAIRIEYDAETPDVRTDLSAEWEGKRESSWKRGDPDDALKSAAFVVDETYSTPVETHNPMEMHGTVAAGDAGRSGCAATEPAGKAERGPADDVHERGTSASHAAAHTTGRDGGWEAHGNPARLLHGDIAAG